MQYMGGKFHHARWICPILIELMQEHDCLHFADLFCGAVNIVANMPATGRRLANDRHPDLIALWQAVQNGYLPPSRLSRGKYARLKATRGEAPDPLRAFAGFGCSYRGKNFAGFVPDGAAQARQAIIAKAQKLDGVEFSCLDYRDVPIPERTLIYCDIPYSGTTQYGVRFDHESFWQWAEQTSRSHPVVVSEYSRNASGRRVIATRRSSSFMSQGQSIPTEEALILLSPHDHGTP